MNIRNTFIIAIGVMIVTGGVFAMSAGTKIVNNSDIQLFCNVSAQQPLVPEGFEEEFCSALEIYLADDLATKFRLVPRGEWIKDGRAVQVNVRLRSQDAAAVTITAGYVGAGSFNKETTSELSLFSSDQPITSLSSKALVRGIGMQLGLLR